MFFTILIGFGLLYGWWTWMDSSMGGGGQSRAQQRVERAQAAATQSVELHATVAATLASPTPHPLSGGALVTPTVTSGVARGEDYELGQMATRVALNSAATMIARQQPSSTPGPTATPSITPTATRDVVAATMTAYFLNPGHQVVGSYWPDDGPDFCLTWREGAGCISALADGGNWLLLDGLAAACPAQWLGLTLEIEGIGQVVCRDMGITLQCGHQRCEVLVLSKEPIPYALRKVTLLGAGE